MTDQPALPTFTLGDRAVARLGYGAMQLAGPHVFGPPNDRDAAVRVLREAVELGVNHLDTSDFYGPHITNQIIREALHPYRAELTIATKVGAMRGAEGEWLPAMSAAELTRAVHDNLRNLGLEVLDVVNLRCMFNVMAPAEGSIAPSLTVLAEFQQRGLIRHIGLSNVTATQVAEGRTLCDIACVHRPRPRSPACSPRRRPRQSECRRRADHWHRRQTRPRRTCSRGWPLLRPLHRAAQAPRHYRSAVWCAA